MRPRKDKHFKGKPSKSNFLSRRKPEPKAPPMEISWPMRLNKYIAHCGICSRREAAELVKQGKVRVNDQTVVEPGVEVVESDKVYYEGKLLKLEQKLVYFLLNKPKDYITTMSDEKGRKTVMDFFKDKVKERIYPVGRLDRNTTGLLLLTNDGDLAKKLSHPSSKVAKVYHVVTDNPIPEEDMDKIRAGLNLEDGLAEVDALAYIYGVDVAPKEVAIEIHSGKNRIVRRIFEHLGYQVVKLDRVYYGGLTKKDLTKGRYRPLTDREIIMLKHFTK